MAHSQHQEVGLAGYWSLSCSYLMTFYHTLMDEICSAYQLCMHIDGIEMHCVQLSPPPFKMLWNHRLNNKDGISSQWNGKSITASDYVAALTGAKAQHKSIC